MATIPLSTKGFPGVPSLLNLPRKCVLAGRNGSGKSGVLSAICLALTGKLAGGGKPGAKQSAEIGIEGNVFDLRALGTMTGPERAAVLFKLLNANVTPEEIAATIAEIFPPHARNEARALQVPDIDKAIRAASDGKTDAEAAIRRLNAVSTPPDISEVVALKELAEINELLEGRASKERERINSDIHAQEIAAGAYKDIPAAEIEKKLEGLKASRTDIADELAATKDDLERLGGDCRALQHAINLLTESEKCPTCGQAVPEGTIDRLCAQRDEKTAKHKKADELAVSLSKDLEKVKSNLSRGSEILAAVQSIAALKAKLDKLPAGKLTAERTAELEARKVELDAVVEGHKKAAAASKELESVTAEASRYRRAEAALKALKGAAAARAGFPAAVCELVEGVTGYNLGFAKDGRSMDVVVSDGTCQRSISTLSAGEFQVVCAAFGVMEPDAVVLVEAAEMDDEALTKAQAMLADHPGPVFIADCHWRNTDPDKWETIALGSEKGE